MKAEPFGQQLPPPLKAPRLEAAVPKEHQDQEQLPLSLQTWGELDRTAQGRDVCLLELGCVPLQVSS